MTAQHNEAPTAHAGEDEDAVGDRAGSGPTAVRSRAPRRPEQARFQPRPPAEVVYLHRALEPQPAKRAERTIPSEAPARDRRRHARGFIPLLWTAALAAGALMHAREVDRRVALQESAPAQTKLQLLPRGQIRAAWRDIGEERTMTEAAPVGKSNADTTTQKLATSLERQDQVVSKPEGGTSEKADSEASGAEAGADTAADTTQQEGTAAAVTAQPEPVLKEHTEVTERPAEDAKDLQTRAFGNASAEAKPEQGASHDELPATSAKPDEPDQRAATTTSRKHSAAAHARRRTAHRIMRRRAARAMALRRFAKPFDAERFMIEQVSRKKP
ncbi:MAG: hypothetical protein ACM31O_21805 [Bacteroidota bacterium]